MANHFSAFRLSFLSFFPPSPSPPFPFSSSILPSGVQSKRSIKRTSHNRLTIVAQSRPPILFDEISQVTKRVSIECYNSYKNVSRVTLTNQTSVIRVILGWLINLMTSQIFNKNINKRKFPWFEHFYWFEVKFTVHETFFQFFDFIPRLIKHYSKYLSIIKISLSSDETIRDIFFFFSLTKILLEFALEKIRKFQTRIIKHRAFSKESPQSFFSFNPFNREKDPRIA